MREINKSDPDNPVLNNPDSIGIKEVSVVFVSNTSDYAMLKFSHGTLSISLYSCNYISSFYHMHTV